jgi:hypothetical protein
LNIRCDETNNSDRLFEDRNTETRCAVRNDVAIDARSLLGEPLKEARSKEDLTSGIWSSLAVLPGNESGQVLLVLNHQIIPSSQDSGSVATCAGAPFWESGGGDFDGLLGVLSYGLGARADKRAAGWVCRRNDQ